MLTLLTATELIFLVLSNLLPELIESNVVYLHLNFAVLAPLESNIH